jgi:hypothetical protein
LVALPNNVGNNLQSSEPLRVLGGPATKQGRAAHDMAYDAVHDEIVFSSPNAQALLTFRGGATGQELPVRVIQGPHAGTIGDEVTVDGVHGELFTAAGGRIAVFDRLSNGDVAPIRVIQGPDAGLTGSGGTVSVDPINDLIVLSQGRGRILIFNRTDAGNVKPNAVIAWSGAKGIQHVRVYPPKGLIVAILGGKAEGVGQDDMTKVAVWSMRDNGNVPPLLTLTDPMGPVEDARRMDFDPKAKQIIVAGGVAIRRYSLPEIF